MEALSLYELNNLVRRRLEEALPDEYWVQAELSDVRSNATGHCYLELIEKDARGNNLIAKARAMIWSQTYRLLRPYFEQETGQAFVSGIKVMVKVAVSFHELYGYSLVITDIDPSYTLGDMARRRREILARLEAEGVLTLNKELPMPRLPQRVAVISSATAAGYGDFCNQLAANPYGYVFYPRLFPAMMQGERVEGSIIAALDRIYRHVDSPCPSSPASATNATTRSSTPWPTPASRRPRPQPNISLPACTSRDRPWTTAPPASATTRSSGWSAKSGSSEGCHTASTRPHARAC